jgi:hypothetical protein
VSSGNNNNSTRQPPTKHSRKREGEDVYSFLHNTFFLFPSCPVIVKKRNMKKKKLLLLLLLWYMRGSLDVPTLAKNKNYTVSFSSVFFSTSSSHSFSPFYQFFFSVGESVVLLCDVFCVCFTVLPLFQSSVPDNEFRMTSHMTLCVFGFFFLFSLKKRQMY